MKRFNEEVYFTTDNVVKVNNPVIRLLKNKSLKNKRKRIRLCAHKNMKDKLHEMFIVHQKGIYIRPHKHFKSESLHVIEGKADIILFDKKGSISEIIQVGSYSSGNDFYYRISIPYYHTMIIKSAFLVFHETKAGPFNKKNIIFAPWAPEESNKTEVKIFMKTLKDQVEKYQKKHD